MASTTTNSVFPLLHQTSNANPSISSQLPFRPIYFPATPVPSPPSSAALCYLSNRHNQLERHFKASVAFNPQGNYDLSILEEDEEQPKVSPPMPPTQGRFEVVIDNKIIQSLDISPFHIGTRISSPSSVDPREFLERTIGFTINYKREDPHDPRELSEFPDVRLWFVRLDSIYPWLPVLLDWRAGELARYAAMLVPHQMSMKMGVVFNPEALELFVMNKVFVVYSWLKQQGVPKPRRKTSDMARMLGFGIGDELFDLIDSQPPIS